MRQAMALSPRPTAVLCLRDVTATGAIYKAQAMGLSVPGDMAIAATARGIATRLAPLTLTTADVSIPEVAEVVLNLLFQCIEKRNAADGSPCTTATIDPVLVSGSLLRGRGEKRGNARRGAEGAEGSHEGREGDRGYFCFG